MRSVQRGCSRLGCPGEGVGGEMLHRRGGKKTSEKVLSHHLSWVVGFFNFTFVALRKAEKERRNAYLI